MDEKYIQDLFNNLGGESKFGKFDDFKQLISTDKKYRQDFYNAFGEKTLGAYSDFDDIVKKKEPIAAPSGVSAKPTQSVSQLPTTKQPSIKEQFGQLYDKMPSNVPASTYVKQIREQSIEDFDVAARAAEKEQRNIQVKKQAVETTATRRLKAKKQPVTEQTLSKEKELLQKDIDEGKVVLTNDNAGQKIYGRQPGAGETFIRGLKASVDALTDASMIAYTKATGSPEELANLYETIGWRKRRDAERQFTPLDLDPMVAAGRSYTETTGLPTAAPSTVGAITEFGGAIAPDILLASATGGAGNVAKMGAIGTKMYASSYANKAHELYEEGKRDLLNRGYSEKDASVMAAEAATENAKAAAIPDAAINTLFFSGKLHSPAANNFVSVMKGAAKDAIKVGALGAAGSATTAAIESAQGYDVDNWVEEMINTGGEFAKLDLLFKVLPILRTLPKAAQSAVKEFAVDPVVKPLVADYLKKLPEGVDVMKDLEMYEAATKDLRSIVSEEKMASLGGRMQKRINRINDINTIKEEIKQLEAKKESMPDALKEEIDTAVKAKNEEIKSLQKEIGNIDKEIEQVKNSKGTGLEVEIDEVSGEPIVGAEQISKPIELSTEIGKLYPEKEANAAEPIPTERGAEVIGEQVEGVVPNKEPISEQPKAEEGVQPSAEPIGERAAETTPTVLGEVTDAEYNAFVDKGQASQERIADIAEKVKSQKQLTEREQAIFADKTAEINKIIAETKPTESIAPTALKEENLEGSKKEISKFEETKQNANDIITGKKVFERFSPQEQRGLAEGGANHVEASILLAENERTGNKDNSTEAQENRVESYAKDKGIWTDNTTKSLTEKYGEPIASGEEAIVWADPKNGKVIKTQDTFQYENLQQKLDGITLHNTYFPEASIKVLGFGRNAKGEFQVIVEQPFIQGEKLTQQEIKTFLEKTGFKEDENGHFSNGETIIEDVHTGNAIKTPQGNIVVIDPIMRLNIPEQGYGGTRKVSNNIIEAKSPIPQKEKLSAVGGEGKPPTPPIEEAGAGIYQEPKRTVFSHRGLQEVATEFGLDDVSPRERKSDLKLFKEVDNILTEWQNEGTYNKNINALLEKAKEEGTSMQVEDLLIAQHIAQLRKIGEDIRRKNGVESKEYDDNLKKVKELVELGANIRSETGARLRVPILARRYSATLEDAMVTKMEALGVDELLPSQKAEVAKLYEQIEKTTNEFDAYRKEAERKFAEMQAQIELNKAQKERSTGGKAKGESKNYAQERKNYIDELKKAIEEYKSAGGKMGIAADGGAESFVISAKIAKIIMKIVGTHVAETSAKLAEIVEKTYNDVKDVFDGITPRDIQDVIAGKYAERKQTASEITAELRQIREEQKLLDEYENLMQGGQPSNVKKAVKRNQRLAELREKIDAIKKEKRLGQYSEEELAKKIIERNEKREKELRQKIKDGDFEKKKKPESFWESEEFRENNPELYKKILDSYTAKEDAQADYDVSILKDQESKKGKLDKGLDWLGEGANTTKKLVTGVDDSALFMQTLAAMFARPVVGAKAIKAHIFDAISRKRYERTLAELHNSPDWDLIKKSGLDVTEPKSLSQEKREEAFSGKTWDIKFKIKGKEYGVLDRMLSPFERAFTSLGNNMRVIAFRTLADKLMKEGYTFEKNPEVFKDLATMLNTETGRGKQNEYIEKATKLVTKGIWSPRLMASRINMLGISDVASLIPGIGTKGYYRQLNPRIRREAMKDLISFSSTVMALSYLAAYTLGGEVDDNPSSQTFLDIKMPDGKSYNISGGFSQYIRLLAQTVKNGQTKNGVFQEFKGTKDSGSNMLHFLRGKLTPLAGVGIDLMTGKDYSGKDVTLLDEAKKLAIPLSMQNVAKDIEKDGLSALFNSTLPSFVGIGVKDEADFPGYKFDEKTRAFLKKHQIPSKMPSNKYVDKNGEETEMTDDEYKKYTQRISERVDAAVEEMEKNGITAKEETAEAYKDAFDLILSDAKEFAKDELFGINPKREKMPVAPKNYRPMAIDKKIRLK
jgi:hypothetical protein